jgi:hypothetical protein
MNKWAKRGEKDIRRGSRDFAALPTVVTSRAAVAPPSASELATVFEDREALDLEQARRSLIFEGGHRAVLDNIRVLAAQPMRNNGWARLFCELMGWVGTREQVISAIVMNFGVSMERAKEAIDAVNAAPKDPHEIARTCEQYLAWYRGTSGPGEPPEAA